MSYVSAKVPLGSQSHERAFEGRDPRRGEVPITGGLLAESMALWLPKAMSLKHYEVLQWALGQGTILPAQRLHIGQQAPPPSLGTSTHRPLLLP